MGKFLNSKYSTTVESIVNAGKERLKNPYYLFTDKKPTIVTYYNINTTKTTYDPDSHIMQSYTDENSPIRYNKIEQAHIFGINKTELDLQMEDFGAESSTPEGEAFILPGTFTPYPQDYFVINYLSDTHLVFKVSAVSPDTFENGANFWRISYRLSLADGDDNDKLDSLVVDSYIMNPGTYGTNFKSVIRKSEYDLIEEIEETTNRMKNFYKDFFFKNKIQTFVYEYKEAFLYDSTLIEFLKKNNILSGADTYTYIHHEVPIYASFELEYVKTFLYSIDTKGKYGINMPVAYGFLINDRSTLMYHQPERYYSLSYKENLIDHLYSINPFPEELLDRIKNNKEYDKDDELFYLNIFIRYFNDGELTSDLLLAIQQMHYEPNKDMFYMMPCFIYILEYFAKCLMKK